MSFRLLLLSDVHFFSPEYYKHVVRSGGTPDAPSRLSTDLALGDRKVNPFHALIVLARTQAVTADAVVCCGDLTMCADPTAMNLGWLQLHRLASALKAGEPIVTVGNHDIDSRFKASIGAPTRALRLLDPPYPTAEGSAAKSYWANGYCILDPQPGVRFVLVNTCSMHGYETESHRHLDHGVIPEAFFHHLADDLAERPSASLNVLVCHHHPLELDLPAEDRSVIENGGQLLEFLRDLSCQPWIVLHGHRHLPNIQYAGAAATTPVVFSAGSLAVNLHIGLQGRTVNQFYILDLEGNGSAVRGRYEAWSWDQHEGDWRKGRDTAALPARGGFGYRPEPKSLATKIAPIVPPRSTGDITWKQVEEQIDDVKFILPRDRRGILEELASNHEIAWESDTGRPDDPPALLRLGRKA